MTDAATVVRVEAAPRPEQAFELVRHLPFSVWLDSSDEAPGTGRWSFVAAQPFGLLWAHDSRAFWVSADSAEPLRRGPTEELAARLDRWRRDGPEDFPLDGGAVGFVGYEAAGRFERLPPPPPGDLDLPDVHLAFFDVVVGWNHDSGECLVLSTGRPSTGAAGGERATRRLEETLGWLSGRRPAVPTVSSTPKVPGADGRLAIPSRPVDEVPWLTSTASRADYEDAVARIIESIRAGDVYQVNLSQRFSAQTAGDPFEIYRRLRRRSPAPNAALVRAGRCTVLSSSPELFLRVDRNGRVETRPIKGTRPRGADDAEDARLASELVESEKDRAENLMIVDLLRNDLSRVCRPGTIGVPELFGLESWATVHHLVSTIRGELADGTDPNELLRATFPSGSVTGAPKIRAMEMIAKFERVARGPYCGAIGYFGFGGTIELSVAIRILVHESGERPRATFHAGGGIVYDSIPAAEYDETLAKARGIVDVIGDVRTSEATR